MIRLLILVCVSRVRLLAPESRLFWSSEAWSPGNSGDRQNRLGLRYNTPVYDSTRDLGVYHIVMLRVNNTRASPHIALRNM